MRRLQFTFVCLFLVAMCPLAFATGGTSCGAATVILSSPYSDTGTFDGDDDCSITGMIPPYNDVFYTFTPSVGGYHQFRVRNLGTTTPAIRIVSGTCCTAGTTVNVFYSGSSVLYTCNNPFGSGTEPSTVVTYARADLVAGVTYWIQVGTAASTASTSGYEFQMLNVPPPAAETAAVHNTCATAQALSYPDSLWGRAGSATPDWYSFVVSGPNPDSVRIYVGGREFGHFNSGLYPSSSGAVDGSFSLYRGCNETLDIVGSATNEGCAYDAVRNFCLIPGTYYLKVTGLPDTAQYILKVASLGTCGMVPGRCVYGTGCNVTCQDLTKPYCDALAGTWTAGTTCATWTLPNPGDLCCTAIPIPAFPFTDTRSNGGYGADYQTTCLNDYDAGPDVVYSFTLTEAKTLRLRLSWTDGAAPGVALFNGCPSTGTCVTSVTGSSSQTNISTPLVNLQPGTYYVMADNLMLYGHYSYSYTLRVTEEPAQCDELYPFCGTPAEVEPNNVCMTQVDPNQIDSVDTVYGRICGGTDHDVYRVIIPARKAVTVQVRDGATCATFPATCTRSDLYDDICMPLGFQNANGWTIENISYLPIERYLDVYALAAGCSTTYKITSTWTQLYDCSNMALCGSPAETEPNNLCSSQVDPLQIGCPTTVYGRICTADDRDVFRVVVPARTNMTIQVRDGFGTCNTGPTCVRSDWYDETCAALSVNNTANWVIANTSTLPLTRYFDVHANPAAACSSTYKITSTCETIGTTCAAAEPILAVPYSATGNFDGNVACSGVTPYNDFLYTITPTVTGPYQFRLRNYGTTAGGIRVVSGSCCSNSGTYSATSVATDCPNPTAPGNEPATVVTYLRAVLTANTQYWIRVGTAASTVSTVAFDFSVTSIPCPPSESGTHTSCATALMLPNYVTSRHDSITGSASSSQHDWYTFTVPTPTADSVRIYCGFNEFGHCNSGVSATVNPSYKLYGGCGGSVDSIGSGLDQGCNLDALNTFCLAPGTYYLEVWTTESTPTTPYVLSLGSVGTCGEPVGRCCYTSGGAPQCGNLLMSECEALSGAWSAGQTCETNPCPTGRCVYGTVCEPQCAVTLQSYCTVLGGTWTAGQNCTNWTPTIPPQGSLCCNPLPISTFPYTDANRSNSNYGSDYQATCLTDIYPDYDGGPDVVYSFTLSTPNRIQITLDWTDGAMPGIALYNGCPDAGTCLATAAGNSPQTSISIPFRDLAAGTYYILVDNAMLWAHYSYTYSLTVQDTARPGQANSVTVTDSDCDSIMVTWADLHNETGYKVYRDGLEIGTTSANDTSFTDAPPAGTYSYTVVGTNAMGDGPASDPHFGTRLAPPTAAPTDVVASDDGCDAIVVTWVDVLEATIYRVYRDTTLVGTVDPGIQHFADSVAAGTYVYTVFAANACGNGPASNVDTGTRLAPPGMVTDLLATDDGCSGIVITWTDVAALGFAVYRDTTLLGDVAPGVQTLIDTVAAGTYTYRLFAHNSCGNGPISNTDTGTRLSPPPAVADLAATDATCDAVVLTWTDAVGATSYSLYRDALLLATIPAGVQTYADSVAAGTYTYKIVAVNSCGNGPDSNTDSGTRLALPAAATNVVATDDGCDGIIITWTDAADALSYDVYRDATLVGSAGAGVQTLTDTVAAGSYVYKVVAVNTCGNGPDSNTDSGTRLSPPSAVTDLLATDDGCNNIVVTWTDVTALGFAIYRDTTLIGDVAPGVQTLTDTVAAGIYTYHVVAHNSCGNGPASNTDTGTRLSPPPAVTDLAASDTGCLAVVITWTDVPGATSYTLYRDALLLGTVPAGVQTYADSVAAGTYTYKIVAVNSCGNGPDSNTDAGTRLALPAAATNVVATDDGCDGIIVTWTDAADALSYDVYRDAILVGSAGAGVQTLTDTVAAGTYLYKVVAVNTCGNGPESNTDTGTRLSPPFAVTDVVATDSLCNGIVISWTDVAALGFAVYRDTTLIGDVAPGVQTLTDTVAAGTYIYHVVTHNSCGNGPVSNTDSGTRLSPPAAVTDLAAGDNGCLAVVITWTDVPGATSYTLTRDALVLGTVNPGVQTYADSAAPGTYVYAIVAVNSCDNGPNSNTDSGTRLALPGAATDVVATDDGCDGIIITWTDAADALSYDVYRDAILVGSAGAGVQTLTDTVAAGTYLYKVVAVNTCGNGPDSNTDSGTRLSPPLAATDVVATDDDCGAIVITWTDAAGATLYHVYRDGALLGDAAPGLQVYVDSVAAGTYSYVIVAANTCGNAPESLADNGTRLSVPAIVTDVAASDNGCTNIVISWTAVSGATGYYVYRDTVEFGPLDPALLVYTDAPPAGSYAYTVRAITACGAGDVSAPDTGTRLTLPAMATQLSPENDGIFCSRSAHTFCWNALGAATSYRVQWDLDGSFVSPEELLTTDTCQSITFAGPGTHAWRVRGENDCGAGEWSTIWTVTYSSLPAQPVLNAPVDGFAAYAGDLLTFCWDSMAEASVYRVQWANEPTFALPLELATSDLCIGRTLPTAGTWYWHTRGEGPCGAGAWSEPRTVQVNALAIPTLVVWVDGDTLRLVWNAVDGATSYAVSYSEQADGVYLPLETTTQTTYTLPTDALERKFFHVIARR